MLSQDFFMQYASGSYWIVRCPRKDGVYTAPIMTNKTGCLIFNFLKEKFSIEDIASHLSVKYHISYQEALLDTKDFLTLLKDIGCYTVK